MTSRALNVYLPARWWKEQEGCSVWSYSAFILGDKVHERFAPFWGGCAPQSFANTPFCSLQTWHQIWVQNMFIYTLHHNWCATSWVLAARSIKTLSTLSLVWISIYLHLQHDHIQANIWLKSEGKVPKYATVFLCKRIKERKAAIDELSAGGGPDE